MKDINWRLMLLCCCGGPLGLLLGLLFFLALVWIALPLVATKVTFLRPFAELFLMPIFQLMKRWVEKEMFSWGRVITVQEGTAVIGQRGGQAVKAFVRWGGHELDSFGEVVDATGTWYPLGGLTFMGFGVEPMIVSARWVSRENGKVVPREEKLEALVVTPLVNVIQVTAAEATGGLVGDFEVDVHFRIINPLQYARVAYNAMKVITSLVTTAFVTQIGRQNLRDIFGHQDEASRALMAMMESSGSLQRIKQEFGLKIERMVIPEIAPADQNLIAAQARAELEAQARVTSEEGRGRAWAARLAAAARGIRAAARAVFRG